MQLLSIKLPTSPSVVLTWVSLTLFSELIFMSLRQLWYSICLPDDNSEGLA